jgi:hypothetical protein
MKMLVRVDVDNEVLDVYGDINYIVASKLM